MITYKLFTIKKTKFRHLIGAVCVDNGGHVDLPNVVYYDYSIKEYPPDFDTSKRLIAMLTEHSLKHTGQLHYGLLTFNRDGK